MKFSIDLNTKKLEALIMATRDELLENIDKLAEAVRDESAQVKEAVTGLSDVVATLTAKVASLESAAGVAADFSAESAKLVEIGASIGAIYEPAPVVS